ncbi:hypothetical protein, partial [Thermogutta sp.]|uniref:hypothetical protein n=1 Tax=Thermogutta sp. TaxID=1962930 RepID=UPI003C7CA8B1
QLTLNQRVVGSNPTGGIWLSVNMTPVNFAAKASCTGVFYAQKVFPKYRRKILDSAVLKSEPFLLPHHRGTKRGFEMI